jgi:hypothetical protein
MNSLAMAAGIVEYSNCSQAQSGKGVRVQRGGLPQEEPHDAAHATPIAAVIVSMKRLANEQIETEHQPTGMLTRNHGGGSRLDLGSLALPRVSKTLRPVEGRLREATSSKHGVVVRQNSKPHALGPLKRWNCGRGGLSIRE